MPASGMKYAARSVNLRVVNTTRDRNHVFHWYKFVNLNAPMVRSAFLTNTAIIWLLVVMAVAVVVIVVELGYTNVSFG